MLCDNSTNIIKKDNRIIKCMTIKRLIDCDIHIPYEQRISDTMKVDEIVKYQLSYLKKHGQMNFLGVINLHKCDDKYYLVDGQHRFEACKQLFNIHSQNIEIVVEIVNVNSTQDLKNNYEILNKNTPLPIFPENINKNIPELTAKYFMDVYPHVWSNSHKCHRPHLYFNYFQETLGYLTTCLTTFSPNSIKNKNDLIKIVIDYNKIISEWNIDMFKGVNEKMYDKCRQWDFYLGLFNYVSNQDYGYEWAKKLVEHITGNKIKNKRLQQKRQNVPKKVRNDSWDINIGEDVAKAYCLVCDVSVITSKNFEAGHIISDKNGGNSNIDNILPICGGCNKSMSFENMDAYIQKRYPNNVSNFINRKYREVVSTNDSVKIADNNTNNTNNKTNNKTKSFLRLF